MDRRTYLTGAATLVAASHVLAQGRASRIAYLSSQPPGDFRSRAFREGLAEFGYTEGRDVEIEYFLAPSNAELPKFAAMAVASEPDVIVAITGHVAALVKRLTTTVPIVFTGVGNPVETGLVASFSRPGGNLTGPSLMVSDLTGKRLQMLAELVPGLERVGRLHWRAGTDSEAEIILAGQRLEIEVYSVKLKSIADLVPALESVVSDGAQAIFYRAGPILANNVEEFAEETLKRRLPAISDNRIFPDNGGLMSYGANVPDTFRRAAYYVDRILRGAKPADLPVEQPRVIDLVINKRTADTLGITIPLKLLIQATELIE